MKFVLDMNSSSLRLLLDVPVLELVNSDWIFPISSFSRALCIWYLWMRSLIVKRSDC